MGLISEFKEFAVKGNVVDMAVGVIIGGAFGKIVSSLVADIIMPPIGVIIGGTNFSKLSVVIKDAVMVDGKETLPAVTWNYGNFIQTTIDFLIIAFVIFLFVKIINKLKRTKEAAVAPTQEEILIEIRDILKEKTKE